MCFAPRKRFKADSRGEVFSRRVCEVRSRLFEALKRKGQVTPSGVIRQMGVCGDENYYYLYGYPVRVSSGMLVYGVGVTDWPDRRTFHFLIPGAEGKRWSFLGEPLDFKGSVPDLQLLVDSIV